MNAPLDVRTLTARWPELLPASGNAERTFDPTLLAFTLVPLGWTVLLAAMVSSWVSAGA